MQILRKNESMVHNDTANFVRRLVSTIPSSNNNTTVARTLMRESYATHEAAYISTVAYNSIEKYFNYKLHF